VDNPPLPLPGTRKPLQLGSTGENKDSFHLPIASSFDASAASWGGTLYAKLQQYTLLVLDAIDESACHGPW
jgi:hypothetical protein